jgi:hypothetical protein
MIAVVAGPLARAGGRSIFVRTGQRPSTTIHSQGARMSDQQGGTLKPVTPTRVAEELRHLSVMLKNGEVDASGYDQRFARMIGELRDRRIQGTRAEILAALSPLKDDGTVTLSDWARLTKQLGLA